MLIRNELRIGALSVDSFGIDVCAQFVPSRPCHANEVGTNTAQTVAKIREQDATVKGCKYKRYIVEYGRDASGKRVRRSFLSRTEAESDIKKQGKLAQAIGRRARRLRDSDLEDAARSLDLLGDRASRLEVAVQFYLDHNSSRW